ncbi:MAG: RNase adapter RapZ [Clostridiales Family XIII bacterium]|jgi:UPF0042 nucleotide-binding protein|nr:RNase adapter RapZ [Clostridiales Family XIII bacterium]
MEIMIITGLSGAGKSQAADYFEDNGYYCIDNLPPSLIHSFLDLIRRGGHPVDKAAFVIDIRGAEFLSQLKENLELLKKEGNFYRILFLDAGDDVLLRRYNESRRAHPLAHGITNAEALASERRTLAPIKKMADLHLDTSRLNNAQLVSSLAHLLGDGSSAETFKVIIQSFGYKYGMPDEADLIFDMRFIPNPFYVDSLKKLTGNSKKVRDYVMRAPEAKVFLEEVIGLFETLKPAYIREGKNSLNIAFGCTGGQHRSVAVANVFFERLKEAGEDVVLRHREVK